LILTMSIILFVRAITCGPLPKNTMAYPIPTLWTWMACLPHPNYG